MPQAFEEPLTVALKLGPRLGVVAYHKRNYEEVWSLSLSLSQSASSLSVYVGAVMSTSDPELYTFGLLSVIRLE